MIPQYDPPVLFQKFIKYLSYLFTEKEEYCGISLMRRELFCKKSQLRIEKLSPTEPDLREHLKRVNYQSYVWVNAMTGILNLPTPYGNEWSKDETSYLVLT